MIEETQGVDFILKKGGMQDWTFFLYQLHRFPCLHSAVCKKGAQAVFFFICVGLKKADDGAEKIKNADFSSLLTEIYLTNINQIEIHLIKTPKVKR